MAPLLRCVGGGVTSLEADYQGRREPDQQRRGSGAEGGSCALALERLQGGKHGYHSRTHDLSATDPRLSALAKDGSPFPGGVIDPDRLATEVERYYDLLGWDRGTGMPMEETLRRLGMGDLVASARPRPPGPSRPAPTDGL